MKKIFLISALICVITATSLAQFKPEKGFTTGVQITTTTEAPFVTAGFNGRYFFNKNLALRCNLNIMYNSTTHKNVIFENYTISAFTFGVAPGLEYHFGKLERLSPYAGIQTGFATHGTKIKDKSVVLIRNMGDNFVRDGYYRFSCGIFIGTDVYVWKGLYAGIELGFDFNYNIVKKGELNMEIGNDPSQIIVSYIPELENKMHNFNFSFNAIPLFKLGWRF